MKHSEHRFNGEKGIEIFWRKWVPDQPRAVIVIVHGLGEHSGRYAHVAQSLNQTGCAVYAIDHRGHGKSGGSRAFVDRFSNAVADIDALVDIAARENAGKPVLMLGHSMGGALSLSHALKHGDKLHALILSGPAVALDGASLFARLLSKMLSVIAPKAGTFAVDPSLVSRDPETVADYASDPLNAHGKVPARTVAEIVNFVEWIPSALCLLELPMLIQHGAQDQLAGVSGSQMVMDAVSAKDKTLKVYDGLYHEIYNEIPKDRARVLADLNAWIAARLGTA